MIWVLMVPTCAVVSGVSRMRLPARRLLAPGVFVPCLWISACNRTALSLKSCFSSEIAPGNSLNLAFVFFAVPKIDAGGGAADSERCDCQRC